MFTYIKTKMARKTYGSRRRRRTPSYKKRRFSRRKRMRRSVARSIRNLKSDYSAVLQSQTITFENSSIAEVKASLQFTLAQLINNGQFTAMFDQYRIRWVRVTFRPVLTTTINRPYDDTTAGNEVNNVPSLCTCIDRDDAAVPTSYYDLKTKQGAKERIATKTVTFKFIPNRLLPVYQAVSNAYRIDPDTMAWVDCGYSSVSHYGLKYAMEVASPTGAFQYEMTWHALVNFRSRRQ